MSADRWELAGEDYDCVYHDGRLPLDWRTKARALLWWRAEVGDWGAALHMARDREIRPVHGVECWASPPTGWYGATWVTSQDPADDMPDWLEEDDVHELCSALDELGNECEGHPDILCLGLDSTDPLRDVAARFACSLAPATVNLVTAGMDCPWFSRVVTPVTIVRLT